MKKGVGKNYLHLIYISVAGRFVGLVYLLVQTLQQLFQKFSQNYVANQNSAVR